MGFQKVRHCCRDFEPSGSQDVSISHVGHSQRVFKDGRSQVGAVDDVSQGHYAGG